jgi:Sigma-70 region 2
VGTSEGVAYRMLGSLAEADDAVQETWLRLSRADAGDIHNLNGWLTTVVARVCLDMLRSRTARAEERLVIDTGRAIFVFACGLPGPSFGAIEFLRRMDYRDLCLWNVSGRGRGRCGSRGRWWSARRSFFMRLHMHCLFTELLVLSFGL